MFLEKIFPKPVVIYCSMNIVSAWPLPSKNIQLADDDILSMENIKSILHASLTFFVLQQQQILGRRFGTRKMQLSLTWLWLMYVLRRWFCCCLLLPLWDFVIVLCFVVRYFMSILILQSSRWGRERAGCFGFFFVFLVSCDCCVSLPHDATDLSAVCDCGISWSYSLTIFELYGPVLQCLSFMCSF